jgi:hypothetical protein
MRHPASAHYSSA